MNISYELFNINNAVESCFDSETGELFDIEKYSTLEIERTEKIESVAQYVKSMNYIQDALSQEIKTLQSRKSLAESKVEKSKKLLDAELLGEPFATPKCKVSFRETSSVMIEDEKGFIEWAKINNDSLLTYKEPAPSKTAIKEAIKSGQEILNAKIVKSRSVTVK